eukprot:589860-Amphidinium_carterae.2
MPSCFSLQEVEQKEVAAPQAVSGGKPSAHFTWRGWEEAQVSLAAMQPRPGMDIGRSSLLGSMIR